MRRAFTLIELLVASILLAMLVTILTMLFNQSSIAWRTGTASLVNLNKTREGLGTLADIYDDVLPGLGDDASSPQIAKRTVSVWSKTAANALRTDRAFDSVDFGSAQSFSYDDAKTAQATDVSSAGSGVSVSFFAVGVRSLGPDGEADTEDDISTWPEEID